MNNKICFKCGKPGYIIYNCYNKKNRPWNFGWPNQLNTIGKGKGYNGFIQLNATYRLDDLKDRLKLPRNFNQINLNQLILIAKYCKVRDNWIIEGKKQEQ